MYCNGLQQYALCAFGVLTWQPMAEGTICCCRPGDRGNCIAHAGEGCPPEPVSVAAACEPASSSEMTSTLSLPLHSPPLLNSSSKMPSTLSLSLYSSPFVASSSEMLSTLSLPLYSSPFVTPTTTITITRTNATSYGYPTGLSGVRPASYGTGLQLNMTSLSFSYNLPSLTRLITAVSTTTARTTDIATQVIPAPTCFIDVKATFQDLSQATCTDYYTTVTSFNPTDCGGCALRTLYGEPGPVSIASNATARHSPAKRQEQQAIRCSTWTTQPVTTITEHVSSDRT